ncbi:MAG: HlyD family type I secretion periplasmic adaptor subunit [Spongiibacteraceae bacterium]|jgi:epimerase transport system membrane fusion protein|nr:HlyD family type I secretion periplasmic adaptor subunit [Spongiibacteraceae bacterium]
MTELAVANGGVTAAPVSDLHIRRIGYTILILVFGVFGGWAALAPLDSAALAPGVVTVKSYRKTVDHLEGGIVREIHVRDGDQVRAGDVLLVLDPTQVAAELEAVRSQLAAYEALEARLIAERDGLPELSFEDDSSDPRVVAARLSEQAIFKARREARLGETAVLEQRIGQLREQIRGLRAVIASKEELIASHREEIADLSALLEEGFVDKQRLREQERAYHRLQAEIADHNSAVARTDVQIGETELQILQLKKDSQEEVANQLAEVQTRVYELRERLAALQDRLTRTVIRAPESGMVLGMQVHTIGAAIRPATPIMDIVPDSGDLIVEAKISPVDIDRVAVGKLADIRFSAFKSSTTHVIEGRLVQISADRLVDETNGMPYYLGRLELTEKGRRDLGELVLVPGMPAEVLINTGERTLVQYLVQPATNALARSLIED